MDEFDRQVQRLISKGYHKEANLTEPQFLKLLEPYKSVIPNEFLIDLDKGYISFVIVIKSELVPIEKAMSLVEKDGNQGLSKLFPLKPEDFKTIDEVKTPKSNVYLIFDIDRGKESLNITPKDALISIKEKKRSPLTIEEGIAIVTQYPEFLMKNNCFSLLASRHVGDKRVPAIWINSKKQPNLGWCWDGNPHTWLGSASCSKRLGF